MIKHRSERHPLSRGTTLISVFQPTAACLTKDLSRDRAVCTWPYYALFRRCGRRRFLEVRKCGKVLTPPFRGCVPWQHVQMPCAAKWSCILRAKSKRESPCLPGSNSRQQGILKEPERANSGGRGGSRAAGRLLGHPLRHLRTGEILSNDEVHLKLWVTNWLGP